MGGCASCGKERKGRFLRGAPRGRKNDHTPLAAQGHTLQCIWLHLSLAPYVHPRKGARLFVRAGLPLALTFPPLLPCRAEVPWASFTLRVPEVALRGRRQGFVATPAEREARDRFNLTKMLLEVTPVPVPVPMPVPRLLALWARCTVGSSLACFRLQPYTV